MSRNNFIKFLDQHRISDTGLLRESLYKNLFPASLTDLEKTVERKKQEIEKLEQLKLIIQEEIQNVSTSSSLP